MCHGVYKPKERYGERKDKVSSLEKHYTTRRARRKPLPPYNEESSVLG